MARTYTEQTKADAVALYVEHGLAEAHRRTEIPKPTLKRWLEDAGLDPTETAEHAASKTAAAVATRLARLESDRLALACDLMADTQRLRAQLFAPCTERKAMIVAQGKELGSHVEVVDIDRDQPPFGEQQKIMTTLAIAVDKVQVLTGQATHIVGVAEAPDRTPEQEAELDRVLHLVADAA